MRTAELPGLIDRLRAISLAEMASVVASAGLPEATAAELGDALRVARRHRWLLDRWLAALTTGGVLRCREGRYAFAAAPEQEDQSELDELYAGLGFPPEMAAVHRAALAQLPRLLADEVTIQELLFTGRDVLTALGAYQTNVFTSYLNAECAALVSAAAQHRARPLRIVEVGGGTGGTTAAVCAALAGIEVEYLFTDISRAFTVAARDRFGVRTGVLDLNRPLAPQGFAPGSADVVVAGNVLHNCIHIGRSLVELRELLAPGGQLVFTESVRDDPAVLTCMQFLLSPEPGADPPRGGEFFLDERAWRDELTAAGFTVPLVLPGDSNPLACSGQRLFQAVATADTKAAGVAIEAVGEAIEAAAGPRPGRVAVFLPGPVPAIAGAEIVTGDPGMHPAKVLATLEREKITTAVLPAALARAIPAVPAAALADLTALACVVVDGPLTDDELAAWSELGPAPVPLRRNPVTTADPDLPAVVAAAADGEYRTFGPPAVAAVESVGRAALKSIMDTLRGAGCFVRPTDRHTTDEILAALRPLPRFRPLVRRWIRVLTEQGLLRVEGTAFAAAGGASWDDAWEKAARVWREVFGTEDTVSYARTCANRLPEVLSGDCDPITLLFPEGRADIARAIYRESVTERYQHRAVAALVSQLAARRDGPLRVLEVGAGTGATTEVLLPALAGLDVEYTFTDVSRYFLDLARAEFGDGLKYRRYDLDADPTVQGYQPGSIDVVVAGGALNAVADTPATVAHLRRLLAPGGWLVLTEPTVEEHWVLISQAFLLTEPRDDRAETGSTFLDHARWNAVLDRAGLHRAVELPPPGHPLEPLGHRVFGAHLP